MKLSGNVILITGGSTGIGLAFAKSFLELDNAVIVTGRSQAKLDEAKRKHPELHTIQSDVSKAGDVRDLAAQLREHHPRFNVLFNNAGIFVHRNFARGADDLEALTSEIDINLSGSIRVISALTDLLRDKRGTIINVSSGLAFVPLASAPIYCATKAAMHSFTTSLRYQLSGTGVEVVELMPPAVRTGLTSDLP